MCTSRQSQESPPGFDRHGNPTRIRHKCIHCGKARSRHHVAKSDGYTFLRCHTRTEIRSDASLSPATYYEAPNATR